MTSFLCDNCGGGNRAEECSHCAGTGVEPGFEIGDSIRFRGEDGAIAVGLITSYTTTGWFELAIDGVTDDLPSIHASLIVGTADRPSLSLAEVDAIVASRLAPVRKPAGNAHVNPVFAGILNSIGGGR